MLFCRRPNRFLLCAAPSGVLKVINCYPLHFIDFEAFMLSAWPSISLHYIPQLGYNPTIYHYQYLCSTSFEEVENTLKLTIDGAMYEKFAREA